MASRSSHKIGYISVVQVVSSIAVIYLHSNCFWKYTEGLQWTSANIIESLFYFAVPCFIMVTGATLIDFGERYSIKEYFIRRIHKTVVPYIIWTFIAIGYRLIYASIEKDSINFLFVINRILSGDAIPIFFFFPLLFGVYLCIPLLATVQKEKRETVFGYLLLAGIIVNSLIPFVKNMTGIKLEWPYSVDVVRSWLFYVVAGAYIKEKTLSSIQRLVIYILGLGGLSLILFGTQVLSVQAGSVITKYKGYGALPCICYSIAVFVFLKQHGAKIMESRIKGLVDILSKYTFAFYLIHWFLLDLMIKYSGIDTTMIWYRLLIPWVILPVMVLITWILRKIPLVKRIVP